MTAVIITASLDPSWVRPLAALRARGVACVVVTVDAAAFARYESDARVAAGGSPVPEDAATADAAAKRTRALRHALAEYELKAFMVPPATPLGEVLAG